jgi:hydrogenase maturation protease
VKVFKPEDVKSLAPEKSLSLHSTDVLGVIELGKTLGEKLADVFIVAVQPEFVGPKEGLSAPVKAALAKAAAEGVRLCGARPS